MATTADTTDVGRRIEDFRQAYERRDLDALMALFADGAEFIAVRARPVRTRNPMSTVCRVAGR